MTCALHVSVLTCERPSMCAQLLGDVVRDAELAHGDISVTVFDDASEADYSDVKRVVADHGWHWARANHNHGRNLHWQWVTQILQSHRTRAADEFIQIPDDVRLCDDFFETARGCWASIHDDKKAALNLLRDHRDIQWVGQEPRPCGLVRETGWSDGAHFFERRFLEAADYSIPAIAYGPGSVAGTGVWAHTSHMAKNKGLRIYQVKRSLLAHVSPESVMHPEVRSRQPIHTRHFIDGPQRLRELCTEAAL